MREPDAGEAEQTAQLFGWNEFRARRGRGTGRRLRKGGGASGVEGHVAFDLLHDLVDVAVEHRHRAEPPSSASAWARLRVPQPHSGAMVQSGIGRRRRSASRRRPPVARQPGELLVAEIAHAAGLEVEDVDQADEMHAALVEAVPAAPLAVAAVAVEIALPLSVVDDVMLARHVMQVEPRRADDLVRVVELLGFERWLMSPV